METRTLFTTLAIVAGLFGASAGNIEDIESYRPVELPIPFWSEEAARSESLASPHIVGGSEATPHSHPHQVILFLTSETPAGIRGHGLCSGSLISDSWVLTAAHCVDKRIIFRNQRANTLEYKLTVTVGAGVHDVSEVKFGNVKNAQLLNVSKITMNPEWSIGGLVNDIAVLKLEKNVVLDGNYVKSIRLPKSSQKTESFKGSTATLSGWGFTKPGDDWLIPTKLQTADSTVIGNLYCKLRYLFILVKETNICTASSRSGPSTCQGDSGGPLVVKEADGEPTLIGITSFGLGCQWGFPNVFTRVTSYLDWIHENTNIAPRN